MKGVILAGGLGTRLSPADQDHQQAPAAGLRPADDLLPDRGAGRRPGITDIMIVTGGNNAGDFLRLLGNGSDFGLKHLNYTYQEGEGGIAEALGLAEHFADGEPVCVVLGDNIIERNIAQGRGATSASRRRARRSCSRRSPTRERFGVAELDGDSVVADRREAEGPEVEPRGDRHLHVRRQRLRDHQDAQAVRPRRARDHRRQQRVHRGRAR